jgi:hypothetical protein
MEVQFQYSIVLQNVGAIQNHCGSVAVAIHITSRLKGLSIVRILFVPFAANDP